VADDPLPLLRSIGQLAVGTGGVDATRGDRLPDQHMRSDPRSVRRYAEEEVRTLLAKHPHRRIIFDWVLKHARARVRDRENLRFDRTRVFGRVRQIFLALGRHFEALGVLAAADDIFYLEVDEVLGFIEGTAVTTDLKALVAVRRAEYVQYVEGPAPDDRFETHGIVYVGNNFRRAVPEVDGGDERRGIGCCPGIVEGTISVVLDPRKAAVSAGTILVAERTDPAWVVLFRTAAGLLVERGSLLSHSAIIAREMGIPTIVAVPGLTRWLRSGDRVRLDGRTGIVRRISEGREVTYAR
jgi:pyruvate,water dikinase